MGDLKPAPIFAPGWDVHGDAELYEMLPSYLERSDQEGDEARDKLLDYVANRSHSEEVFETTSLEVCVGVMHEILELAQTDIVQFLDEGLLSVITLAQSEYSVRVDKSEMYAGRVTPWGRLTDGDIQRLDRGQTIEYLKAARGEIGWLKHEINHIKTYMVNSCEVNAPRWDDKLKAHIQLEKQGCHYPIKDRTFPQPTASSSSRSEHRVRNDPTQPGQARDRSRGLDSQSSSRSRTRKHQATCHVESSGEQVPSRVRPGDQYKSREGMREGTPCPGQ